MPAVSSVIGGHLTEIFDWRATFILLTVCSILIFLLVCYFQPKKKPTYQFTSFGKIFQDAKNLYLHPTYAKYVLPIMLSCAGLYVFYTIAPFLIIHELHYSPHSFGHFMFIPVAGLLIGRIFGIFFGHRWSKAKMIYFGILYNISGSLLMLFFTLINKENEWTLMGSMGIYLIGLAIISTSARAGTMMLTTSLAATAASLLAVSVNLFFSVTILLGAKVYRRIL